MLASGAGGRVEARPWYRGKNMTGTEHGPDWKLRPGTPEGLIFKARVNMYFCGVMWSR